MKKKVLSILGVLLISISTLTGCAKCIDKKEESVKVTVVNEYYKPKETLLWLVPFIWTCTYRF